MDEYKIQAYKNFLFCFEDMKNGRRDTRQVSEEKAAELKQLYESREVQGAMDLVEYFETKFTCSGVCEKSLFFFTLPMKEGPPSETCLTYMKATIADNLTYMGMTV